MPKLNLNPVCDDWLPLVQDALSYVDTDYLQHIQQHSHWLPGPEHIFNAFSLPLAKTHYLLLGESPYPRQQSANGYAFWDAAVSNLWSKTGLSREVNRATSLRNFIKMLLCIEGYLTEDRSQAAIAAIDKSLLVTSLSELFRNMLNQGFLLLNASLVLSSQGVKYDARAWQPFVQHLLLALAERKVNLQLILFGKVATSIHAPSCFSRLLAEHPYNISFIDNPKVRTFFQPLHLLHAIS